MERCDRCDLYIGLGCACALPGARASGRASGGGPIRWVRFEPDTILISSRRMAHLPGACDHMTESDVVAPAWGWVRHPEPGVWGRIGEGHPVHATEGNVRLTAVTRCSTCLATLGGR